MKLTEFTAKARERGVEMNLSSVKTDSVGNVLTIVVPTNNEPLLALLREEGYLIERESVSPIGEELTELTPKNSKLFPYIQEELTAIAEKMRDGRSAGETQALLLSCIGSLEFALSQLAASLNTRLDWVEEDLLRIRRG